MTSIYSNDAESIGESLAIAEECPVCSQMAYSKHFGRVSCNACAGILIKDIAILKIFRNFGFYKNFDFLIDW